MKIAQEKKELKTLSFDELIKKLNGEQRELFSLRLNAAINPLKDSSMYKKYRKRIARIKTCISTIKKESL